MTCGCRLRSSATEVNPNAYRTQVICLQEWFFDDRWKKIFRDRLPTHRLISSQRHGFHPRDGSPRRDGLAILSKLPIEKISEELFEDGRTALTATLGRGGAAPVVVACCHLQYGGRETEVATRAYQAAAVAAAAESMAADAGASMAFLVGDFNEIASGTACAMLENRNWTNAVSAAATAALDSGTGGRTAIGSTHLTHEGTALSCDHIFCTDFGGGRYAGCFDAAGSRLDDARRVGVEAYHPEFALLDSDHLPVRADVSFDVAAASPPVDDAWLPPWPQPPDRVK